MWESAAAAIKDIYYSKLNSHVRGGKKGNVGQKVETLLETLKLRFYYHFKIIKVCSCP